MKKILAILLAMLLCATCIPALAEEEAAEVDYIQNIPYIDDGREEHMLDVHGVDPDSDALKPVIVEVHGGGYIGGNKGINTEHAEFYAQNGFAVVNTDYIKLPEGNFKTVIQELFATLHWVEAHAEEYHFDLNNVFMSGDSAGGYFVNLMAVVLNTPDVRDYFEVEMPGFEIKGYALTCPGTDVMALRDNLGKEGPAGFTSNKIGEEILMDDELMSHCDLYSVIDPATFPEVYFITTPTDASFYSHSVKLDAFLTENQVQHSYKEYVGTDGDLVHVFNISEPASPDGKLANDEMIAYLKSLVG